MDFIFKRVLFCVLMLSALAEVTVFEARIESLPSHTTNNDWKADVQTPDAVYMSIITDNETFSFHLTRKRRQSRNIPVLTTVRDTLSRRHVEIFKKDAGLYRSRNSTFFLNFSGGIVSSCEGFFHTANHVYTAQPKTNSTSHDLIRHPYSTFSFSADENMSGHEEILPMRKRPQRKKRQMRLYEIELFVVVDFALFRQLMSFNPPHSDRTNESEELLQDIVHQFSVIVDGMDARFYGIRGSDYVIDVVFVGIYIAQNISSSSWSETVKEPSSPRPVINENSMKLFIEWMKLNQHDLPHFDHAMAFTAYNLRKDDNHKTIGLGYTQSMCTDRRFSIVEHHGDLAYVSYIATHELAHSLGAKHDGYPARVMYGDQAKVCRADDGYIMCPKASRDPDSFSRKWQFSACSLLYFDFYIDHLNENNTNCMSRRSVWNAGKEPSASADDNIDVYSPDEQCERKHGEGFVLDRTALGDGVSSICHSIPCTGTKTRTSVLPTLPLEGTACGHGKICHLGRCVEGGIHKGDIRELPKEGCVLGDQPGNIADTRQTCRELLGPLHVAYKCYTYEQQCCHICNGHIRHFSTIKDCQYGDRKELCSAGDCANDAGMCCETCAFLSGKLRECQTLSAPENGHVHYNTRNIHHGTVATFSCAYGSHLTGNSTSVCLEYGIWDSASPKCVKGCLLPKLPPHMIIEDAEDRVVEHDSRINTKCEHGFILKGNHTLECKENGTFDNNFPKCTLAFTSPSTIYLPENTAPGSPVHRLFTGSALSSFRLVYFSHPGFKVNADGSIEVGEGGLDYEDEQSYSLMIGATSTYDSRFKAQQRLTINVQDLNEFVPKFTYERYCIILQRPFVEEMSVFSASAIDRDASGFNISYRIRKSATKADIFRIDSLTGDVVLKNAAQLNNSYTSVFILEVLAEDSGKPQLTGTCTVEINVEQECHRNSSNNRILTSVLYSTVLFYTIGKAILV